MTVTIETSGTDELEQLLEMLKTLNVNVVSIKPAPAKQLPIITRGDKKINPKDLFGIWKSKPRSLELIRTAAWKRNQG